MAFPPLRQFKKYTRTNPETQAFRGSKAVEKDPRIHGVLQADFEWIFGGGFLLCEPLNHTLRELSLACLWDELHERRVVSLKPLMHRGGISRHSDPPKHRDPPPPALS